MITYPIKFEPILKEKIWGGNKLKNQLGKNTKSSNIGESWEISGVEGNISIVSNGIYKGKTLQELISLFSSELLGGQVYESYGKTFPLLIKFLDAKTDLSVQVHPDDSMAKKYHNSFGKTEMWYIMDSEKQSEIILGLKQKTISPSNFKNISKENIDHIFNRKAVKKGESYFVPAGKVHAIGAGVLAAEIQQTSDITYRVYDWDRKDSEGNLRDLHTDLAVEATKPSRNIFKTRDMSSTNSETALFHSTFFNTNLITVSSTSEKDYSNLDSFVILMCVEGTCEISTHGTSEILKLGETALLPAVIHAVKFTSSYAKLIEVHIPEHRVVYSKKVS